MRKLEARKPADSISVREKRMAQMENMLVKGLSMLKNWQEARADVAEAEAKALTYECMAKDAAIKRLTRKLRKLKKL